MRIGVGKSIVLLLLALCVAISLTQRASANPSPFYMGGDISLESYFQGQFPDNGSPVTPRAHFFETVNGAAVEKPMDTIMYDHGANLFRLRVFVNPPTNYTSGNVGAIQSNAYDIALAQQIKADCPNAKFVLDFHYSDTWADPGHQSLPAAWASPAQTLTQLESTVQNYTQSTLQTFKDAGVMPDIVQIGNETTGGTMWPTGKLNFYDSSDNNPSKADQNASWAAYGGLWNAAIRGVRAMETPPHPGDPPLPRIPVALSIDRGDKDGQPQYHYGFMQASTTIPDANGFTGGGVTDFDIEGVDYYPTSSNLATTMNNNLKALAETNFSNFNADVAAHPDTHLPMKKIMLLETNSPWRNINGVGDTNQFPKTLAGQQLEFQTVTDLIYKLPHDDGEGVLWWYPEGVIPGANYNNGSTALFDSATGSTNHNALPALDVLNVGDYNRDGVVDAADFTVWRDTLGSTTNLLANGDNTGASQGVIDQADYNYWLAHFAGVASSSGAGAASTTSVPEPSTWLLALGAVAILGGTRRYSRP
ncbi:MAG TPA: glycosyl hydrolase 53 family protein [Lacipirellulaceae bacterium]